MDIKPEEIRAQINENAKELKRLAALVAAKISKLMKSESEMFQFMRDRRFPFKNDRFQSFRGPVVGKRESESSILVLVSSDYIEKCDSESDALLNTGMNVLTYLERCTLPELQFFIEGFNRRFSYVDDLLEAQSDMADLMGLFLQ